MTIPRDFDVDPGYSISPVGNGLIHKTYLVSYADRPTYVLQRLNTDVFPDPDLLERNTRVVTECIREAVLARGGDETREVLRFVPTGNGRLTAETEGQSYWRLSHFVQDSITVDVAKDVKEAAAVAGAFASLQQDLWDVSPDEVTDAIPGFHDTPRRYRRLQEVIRARDKVADDSRFAASELEIAQVQSQADLLGIVETDRAAGKISTRICHNDTKVNNVLLDRTSRRPLCVIDFDTVGPGSPLMDVGDLLRTASATASEEERDVDRVGVDVDAANAIVHSFGSVLQGRLNGREQELLAFAGWLITMEQAIRYLTDYLEGDPYYGERYPGHNLYRTRNQLKLARAMEERVVNLSEFG